MTKVSEKHYKWDIEKNGIAYSTVRNLKTAYLWNFSFPLEQPTKLHFRSTGKIEALIFPSFEKFKKQMALPCKLQKKFKGSLFHCQEISDHKYWWSGKTLSVLPKYVLKPGSFFINFSRKVFWKMEKLKCQNFKKMYVHRPSNRKHSFFITLVFYQLTNFAQIMQFN